MLILQIGICGRTGSGKSSMTLSLFKIIDIFSGKTKTNIEFSFLDALLVKTFDGESCSFNLSPLPDIVTFLICKV